MTALRTISHTRTAGKRLTYTIKVYGNKYVILLGDKLLKQSVRVVTVGGVDPIEADLAFAIADVEKLLGMSEE